MKSNFLSFLTSKWSFSACLLAVIFLSIQAIFLVAYNPGLMSPDSFDQLKQARLVTFFDWHPVFSTLYVYFFDNLFGSPIGVAVANSVLFLFFLLIIFETFKENRKQLYVVLAFYLVMPIYYLYNITLWKDVPYSYFLAIGVLFLYRFTRHHKIEDFILFLSATVLVTLFRYNGITVAIAAAISIILLPKVLPKFKVLGIVCLFAAIIISKSLVNLLLPSDHIPAIINLSNPYGILLSHMSSLPHTGGEELMVELEDLSVIIEPEKLAASYNPGFLPTLFFDPKIGLDHNKVLTHKRLVVKTFIKLFIRHPLLMSRSIIEHGALAWNPFKVANHGYYVVEAGGNVCDLVSRAYSEYKCEEYKLHDIQHVAFISPDFSKNLDSIIFNENYTNILFMRPAWYLYAMIISVLIFLRKQKKGLLAILIVSLPILAQTATMFFFVQAQDFRYHYALVSIAPVFVLMTFVIGGKGSSK